MVSWRGDRVSTVDSIQLPRAVSGAELRDAYDEEVRAFTFGLIRMRGGVLRLGRIELLGFGSPKVTGDAAEWTMGGGLLSAGPGGTLRIESSGGRVTSSLESWAPRLPRPIYVLSQLQVHLLFTRLYLLRLRGREPAPGRRAPRLERLRAAVVDIAFCLTLAGLTGRRRPRRALAIAAIYHAACWSLFGRTLGSLVMRQRVVAVDGSRVTPLQALYRLALIPASWITRRPLHDELAATDVISDNLG